MLSKRLKINSIKKKFLRNLNEFNFKNKNLHLLISFTKNVDYNFVLTYFKISFFFYKYKQLYSHLKKKIWTLQSVKQSGNNLPVNTKLFKLLFLL